jgi:hypothetical protein
MLTTSQRIVTGTLEFPSKYAEKTETRQGNQI